jgi:GNAT superfamily N-acetyltransferase
MRCHEDPDPGAFARQVWPFLEREPVLTNVIATVVEQAAGIGPTPGSRWLRIHEDGRLVGAAIWTPPRGVGLSPMPTAAAETLADFLVAGDARPPAVDGPDEPAAAFARRYAARTGRTCVAGMAHRLFRLDRVVAPAGVPGRARPADGADRQLILRWLAEFDVEADPGRPRQDDGPHVDRRLAAGPLMWFWEVDGEPVSFAYRSGMSPGPGPKATVCRISAVYTPPEHRAHGYASANVAAISQNALDGGASACMLYTDRANPTSNKIYQAIGYRPLGTAARWRFD